VHMILTTYFRNSLNYQSCKQNPETVKKLS
jgi:hypothetical protein